MHALNQINNNKGKLEASFLRLSRAASPVVSGGIWPKFEIIQAFTRMYIILTFKYEKDMIKIMRKT